MEIYYNELGDMPDKYPVEADYSLRYYMSVDHEVVKVAEYRKDMCCVDLKEWETISFLEYMIIFGPTEPGFFSSSVR